MGTKYTVEELEVMLRDAKMMSVAPQIDAIKEFYIKQNDLYKQLEELRKDIHFFSFNDCPVRDIVSDLAICAYCSSMHRGGVSKEKIIKGN